MSFGKELCKLSDEATATKNDALRQEVLREGEEVWNLIKEALKKFAQETGERGCNIFFQDFSIEVIAQLISSHRRD